MSSSYLTDTHCHLYLEAFRDDLDQVLDRGVEAGVREIYLPAIDWESLEAMNHLSHPRIRFFRMAGIHPCEIHNHWPLDENRLYDLARDGTYCGIGETGLDYHWSRDYVEVQKKSLTAHCRIARATGKPIVLHNRDSTEDLLDLIEEEQDGSLRGVWHCFTGSVEEGLRAIDLGLHLGIGGVLTFRNSDVERTVTEFPVNRLLIETDAPYLAPAPRRGKRNEPSYVRYTAEKLAEALEMTPDKLAEITSRNASDLFG